MNDWPRSILQAIFVQHPFARFGVFCGGQNRYRVIHRWSKTWGGLRLVSPVTALDNISLATIGRDIIFRSNVSQNSYTPPFGAWRGQKVLLSRKVVSTMAVSKNRQHWALHNQSSHNEMQPHWRLSPQRLIPERWALNAIHALLPLANFARMLSGVVVESVTAVLYIPAVITLLFPAYSCLRSIGFVSVQSSAWSLYYLSSKSLQRLWYSSAQIVSALLRAARRTKRFTASG